MRYCRRNPNSVTLASLSAGTRSDFLGQMFKDKAGGNLVISPYKGSAPAITDLLGNNVQLAFEVVTNVAALIKTGRLKGIAVVSSTRSPFAPNVPTFAEQGLPDFVMPDASVGVFMMSNMPKPLADRIQQEISKAISSPSYLDALAARGLDMPNGSVAQLRLVLDQTKDLNLQIIDRLKLKLNPD
jgi:tripartite-type tricarboxylate transporter receptor subunit TctC